MHKQAQAQKTMADAKMQSESAQASIANTNVNTQKAAFETALGVMGAPALAPIADGLLHEAGFRSRTEAEDDEMLEAAQARQAQAQQAAQQQAMQQQQMEEQQEGEPNPNGPQPMAPMQ